jgi:hypothetical protein
LILAALTSDTQSFNFLGKNAFHGTAAVYSMGPCYGSSNIFETCVTRLVSLGTTRAALDDTQATDNVQYCTYESLPRSRPIRRFPGLGPAVAPKEDSGNGKRSEYSQHRAKGIAGPEVFEKEREGTIPSFANINIKLRRDLGINATKVALGA